MALWLHTPQQQLTFCRVRVFTDSGTSSLMPLLPQLHFGHLGLNPTPQIPHHSPGAGVLAAPCAGCFVPLLPVSLGHAVFLSLGIYSDVAF